MRFARARLLPVLAVLAFAGGAAAYRGVAPAEAASASSLANGRAIFQTGRDLQGTRIVAHPPPLMPSCAACHRSNGAGGVKLPGGVVSADLRPSALVAGQKHPYTLKLLERAISTGIDNEGKPLNRVMPHWKMSQRDLDDVARYVLTGLK